jgi:hypothetical protein
MWELSAFWSAHSEFYERSDPFHNPQIEYLHEHVGFADPPRRHALRPVLGEADPPPFGY